MIVLALAAAVAAFTLFALTTDAHGRTRQGARPTSSVRRRCRLGGSFLILVAFALSVAAQGWRFGPVTWVGLTMAAAGLVFLAINVLPARSHGPTPRGR